MGKENFNMDDWVMRIDAVENSNDLRNVKDYIHYKLRMEVRKEISENSIRIKEQELEALKSKRNNELNSQWKPSNYESKWVGENISVEQAREIEARLNKNQKDNS
jgi:hypothetical protein